MLRYQINFVLEWTREGLNCEPITCNATTPYTNICYFKSYLKREYKEKQLIPDISTSDNLNLKRFTKDFLVSLSIEWQRRTQ